MTKSSNRAYRFVPLLFTVFLLMPMAALAQESNTQAAEDRAILHDVALSFTANSDRFSANLERAWRMHAEVLGMRTAGEARYVHCAQMHGHLAYHMGNLKESQEAFEAAGEGAMLRGEIYDAATSFVYAALTAASRSRFADARRLGQRAALLVESPVLNAEERMTLERRLPGFLES